MNPILYESRETDFNHNGLGKMNETLSAIVTEVANGEFELEVVYPIGGRLYKHIQDHMLIKAKPNSVDDPHVFRIYEHTIDTVGQTVTIYAHTKSNDLGQNLVKDVVINSLTPQEAMNAMKTNLVEPTDYSFVSDITTRSSTEWKNRNPLNCIAGEEGSLIHYWGGEIKRDNRTIYLYRRRGRDNVAIIRDGKNINGLSLEYSTKGMVTKIIPYRTYTPENSDDEVVEYGTPVESQYIGNYPLVYVRAIDYSNDDDVTSLQTMNTKASRYFTENNGVDKPSVNVSMGLVELSDSSEYEKFKDFENVELFDSVTVYSKQYDIHIEAKITTVVYDSLAGKNISLEMGSYRTGLIESTERTYMELIGEKEAKLIQTIQVAANGKNRVFRGVDEPTTGMVKNDLWYKPIGDGETEMYQFDGAYWQLILSTLDTTKVQREVDVAISEAEAAKQAAEQSYTDSVAEAERLVQVQTDTFNTQISDVNEEINTVKTNIGTDLTNINQTIANNFTSLSTSIDNATDLVNTANANAQTALNNAQSAINQLDGLSGQLTDVSTEVDTINGVLLQKVSTADFNSLTGRVNVAEGQIQTQANQIALRVTETQAQTIADSAVDGIEVGGRNLYPHTKNEWTQRTFAGWQFYLHDIPIGEDENLRAGDEITWSGIVNPDNEPTGIMAHFITDTGGYVQRQSNYISGGDVGKALGHTVVPSNAVFLMLALRHDSGSAPSDAVRYRELKIEKGNKATDWTPAPEDTTALISTLSSELSIEKDNITSLLTRTSNNETAITQVKATADGTKTTVANHAGRLTTVETNISGLQTTVADKVSNAQFTVLSNSVSSVVSDLNNLEIGGRNLVLNTAGKLYITFGTGATLSEVHGATRLAWTGNSQTSIGEKLSVPLVVGEYYTLTFEARGTLDSPYLEIYILASSGANLPISSSLSDAIVTEEFKKYKATFKFTGYPSDRLFIGGRGPSGRWLEVKDSTVKLEKGNKATDWTPAPEDMATQSQITQLSTDINLRVTKGDVVSQLNIDAGRVLIQTNKLLLDANTYIMGTTFANDVKAKSLEAITANITSIRSQVLVADSVTSTHIKAENALIDSLFATTALVTRLTSKTAFINNIKAIELSASKITSGTLNSTIVNAISLNVSQLVGNTTNFVQSNWNNANTSIAIDATNGITARNASSTFYTRLTSGLIYFGDDLNTTVGSIGSMVREGSNTIRGVGIYVENNKEFGVAKRWSASGAYEYIMRSAINSRGLDILTPLSVRATMNMHGNQIHNANRIYFGDTTEGIMRYPSDGTLIMYGSEGVRLGNGNATNYTTRVHIGSTTTTIHNNLTVNSDATFNANLNMGAKQITNVNSVIMQGGTTGLTRSYTNTAVVAGSAGVYLSFGTPSSWSQRLFVGDTVVRVFRNLDMNSYTITGQSDRRLKTDITPTSTVALDGYRQLNMVDFRWKDPSKPSGCHLGVIAQDTPFWSMYDAETDTWMINSGKQIMYNSLGIKELTAITDKNTSDILRIDTFVGQHEQEIQLLKQKIAELERKIA